MSSYGAQGCPCCCSGRETGCTCLERGQWDGSQRQMGHEDEVQDREFEDRYDTLTKPNGGSGDMCRW